MNRLNRILILGLLLIFKTSCSKKVEKYYCTENCEQLTVKMNLVDSSLVSDKSYFKNARYEIYFSKQASGLFSNPIPKLIRSGKVDNEGVLYESFKVDTSLLNDNSYSVKIVFKLSSEFAICEGGYLYEISSYPIDGKRVEFIPVRKLITRNIELVRTQTDVFTQGEFFVTSSCGGGGYLDIVNTPLNTTKNISMQFAINATTNFVVRKFPDTSGYVDQKETIRIGEDFSGMRIEY